MSKVINAELKFVPKRTVQVDMLYTLAATAEIELSHREFLRLNNDITRGDSVTKNKAIDEISNLVKDKCGTMHEVGAGVANFRLMRVKK